MGSYMTMNLGLTSRSVGVFGFSMGAYGSLSIVNTYTQNVAAIYSANAPMYPNDCFFAYNCHAICMTDMIYCELLFTSFGQVINSYVILWGTSAVVSTGSLDPVGTGVANHMVTYAAGGLVGCMYDTSTATGTELSVTVGDYISHPDPTSLVSPAACTWQEWASPAKGETCVDIPAMLAPVKKGKTTETSVHVAFSGFSSDNGQFACASSCMLSDITASSGVGEVWTYSSKAVGEATCFAFVCQSVTWCVELNESEGAGAYLDPVASLVASMKFVPFSNVVSDSMIPSAYSKFFNSMPITKFTAENDSGSATSVYTQYATLMYIHCSQNDEMGLYPFHMQYVAMILGALTAMSSANMFNTGSEFVADFDDCDMHFFSEHDMKVVISWFSDSLHTFVNEGAATASASASFNMNTVLELNGRSSEAYALCWLKRSGEFDADNGAVVSTPKSGRTAAFLHKVGCSGNMMSSDMFGLGFSAGSQTWPDMFTHAAWHGLDAENEQHMDEDSSVAVYNAANPADKVECDYLQTGADLEQAGTGALVQAQLLDPSAVSGGKANLKQSGRSGAGKTASRGSVGSAGCVHLLPPPPDLK